MGKKLKIPSVKFPVDIPDTIMLPKTQRGRTMWRLQKDFLVVINGKSFIIPRGFIFDYASIPRWLWPIYNPTDPVSAAPSMLHDLNCDGELWPRKDGDLLFLAGLIERGAPKWKQKTMYRGVRVGSGSHALKLKISKKARRKQNQKVLEVRRLLGLPASKSPYWKTLPR